MPLQLPPYAHQMLTYIQNNWNNISAKITDLILSFTTLTGPIHLLKGHHIIEKLNRTQRYITPNSLPAAAILIAHRSPRHQDNEWIRVSQKKGSNLTRDPLKPQGELLHRLSTYAGMPGCWWMMSNAAASVGLSGKGPSNMVV